MKKFLSLLLAVIMMVSVILVAPINVSAATCSKTLTEAMAWLESKEGQPVGDGECVALTNAYLQYLGLRKPDGAYFAKDWATNNYDTNYLTRIAGATPQPGDILIWIDGPFNAGHVAICGNSGKYYHQNYQGRFVKALTESYTSGLTYRDGGIAPYYGVLRPHFSNNTHTTHSYDTYVYNWDAHPHYKCYQCFCGEVITNKEETTYIDSCVECQSHTCNKDIEYSYWEAHPHYLMFKCSLCDKVSTDYTQTRHISTCEECQSHNCNKDIEYSYWEAHPHYLMFKCSLCDKVSTDYTQTKHISSCNECFAESMKVLGDTDDDGKVTIKDATAIQKHVASLIVIDEEKFVCADTDKDNKITVKDATRIQKFLAALIPEL
ncbi:MAG: CHAP domain-containing protein [Clostridia bacterium]|nr:CHAP domain-containing protein [Clostridia bacterium]